LSWLGGSGVRVSARPDIFASELPRRLASDHRVSIDLQHYTAGSRPNLGNPLVYSSLAWIKK
jgi:hypothetical protein